MRNRSAWLPALLALVCMLALPPSPVRGDVLWTLLPQQSNPPSTYGLSVMVRDSRRARFVATSGVYRSYFHGPIVSYNTVTWSLDLADTVQPWRPMSAATASPTVGQASAAYDSVSDRVYLFGGSQQIDAFSSTFVYPRELRVLDLSAGTAWETRGVAPSDPPGLTAACLTVDPIRRRLLLYGGRDSLGATRAELWAYGIDSGTWSLLTPAGVAPAGRYNALMVYDAARDRVVLTCGRFDANTSARDTWTLSLAGPPAWSLLDDGTTTTGGPLVGGIDPLADRIVAAKGLGPPIPASSDTVRVAAFDLTGATGWQLIPANGVPPYPGSTGAFPAAFDPIGRRMPLAWSLDENLCTFCLNRPARTHVLLVGPQPTVGVTAALDSATYLTGGATLHWTLQSTGRLYAPPVVREVVGPTAPRIWRTDASLGGYPDSAGRFVATAQAAPGQHYEFVVEWLDGATVRSTPVSAVDTPPAPVSTIVELVPLGLRGGDVGGGAHVTGDSTRWLASIEVQRRGPTADWSAFRSYFPDASGDLGWLDLAPTRLVPVTYRLAWGPLEARRYSAEQSITVPPQPAFERRTATPDSIEIVWFMAGGFPLTGTVYAVYYNGIAPLDTVRSDAGGHVRFVDHHVVPDGVYQYQLGWDDSGVPTFTEVLVIPTPSREPGPGPPPAALRLALRPPRPNPASGLVHFSFTLADSNAASPARLELIDLTGRLRWSSVAWGSGSHEFDLGTHALPEGLYFLRLTQNGVSRQRRITLLH